MAAIRRRGRSAAPDAVITTAQRGRSADLASREKRYAVTMGMRVVCFVLAAVVSGPARWALLAAAAFLPGIAVLFANAIDLRSRATSVVHEPPPRPALPRESDAPRGPTTIDHE